MTPTGRQRHRVHQLWGKKQLCVLQFEYEYTYTTSSGGWCETEQKLGWFDAKPGQLTTEGESPYVHASSKTPGSYS